MKLEEDDMHITQRIIIVLKETRNLKQLLKTEGDKILEFRIPGLIPNQEE